MIPQTEAGERKKESFLARAWSGRIPLWQALLIVNVGGWFAVLVVTLIVGAILIGLREAGLLQVVDVLLTLVTNYVLRSVHAVFSIRCIWLSAYNPRGSVWHALARLWACLITLYVVVSFIVTVLRIAGVIPPSN